MKSMRRHDDADRAPVGKHDGVGFRRVRAEQLAGGGGYEHWQWRSIDRTGDPSLEVHEVSDKSLAREEKEKAPWEEGWRICWTIGKQEPVLHTGGSVMPFNPGGR